MQGICARGAGERDDRQESECHPIPSARAYPDSRLPRPQRTRAGILTVPCSYFPGFPKNCWKPPWNIPRNPMAEKLVDSGCSHEGACESIYVCFWSLLLVFTFFMFMYEWRSRVHETSNIFHLHVYRSHRSRSSRTSDVPWPGNHGYSMTCSQFR